MDIVLPKRIKIYRRRNLKRHFLFLARSTNSFTFVNASVTRLGDLLNFLKPLATINLPKSPTFLGKFCKGVKIYKFSSDIIFGQLLQTFGGFFWSRWLGEK